MKKQIFSLILFLFVNLIQAQNPLVKQWDKRFGGTEDEVLYSLQQTKDEGYILCGYSNSDSSGNKTQNNRDTIWFDYWIVKTNSVGNKQWDKRFGGNQADYLLSAQQTNDGGYILGGTSDSDSSGDKTQPGWGSYDYWIVKIDSLGNKQWDKRFGGTDQDELHALQQTSDEGYILGGYSYSGVSGDKTQPSWGISDYWIVKIDSIGNKQWDKRFGGAQNEQFRAIQQTTDGGYILGGNSNSDISGDKTQNNWNPTSTIFDFWLVKIDSLGNKQWDKRFGGTSEDGLSSLQQTTDVGFILAGLSYSQISGDKTQNTWGGNSDYWMVKIDSSGTMQWDKDYGGTGIEDEFGNITQTADTGYLIAGTSYSNISGDKTQNNLGIEQSWIIKTDSSGIKQWDKTVFTNGHDETCLAIQTKDGCYVAANFTSAGIGGEKTQPSWNNSWDYWFIKFCDTTSTTSISQFSNYPFSFSIYPNPTQRILTITLTKSKKITVINLLGEIIIEKNISSILNGKVDLDISFLSSGIYFIKVDNEVKKFVKE